MKEDLKFKALLESFDLYQEWFTNVRKEFTWNIKKDPTKNPYTVKLKELIKDDGSDKYRTMVIAAFIKLMKDDDDSIHQVI